MGQVQFMPSSYLKFAQDFDGDGRKDIWKSQADVFASIANYLKENGWTPGQLWGREATIPAASHDAVMIGAPLRTDGCRAERDLTVPLSLSQWQDLGVRGLHGHALPRADLSASLLTAGKRRFLVYPNYGAILRYNCANAYALTVGVLADRLAAGHASR
jgi:membrane-bound lytic murein transglycosylase B